jgi:glyoxylase-like metal-dependent hydrolase (beta-lactamase superfamily II)
MTASYDANAVAIAPIDLRHQASPRVIGSYLLATDDGPALFDCGPTSTLDTLRAELRARRLDLRAIRHLLLSHIHLDHAGAAGAIVREHPDVRVHVSAVGAPHLTDPTRLEASARRLYGASFDALWGELVAVPETNIEIASDEVLGLAAIPTPGHASHHVCYLDRDGTLFAGDACGVRIAPNAVVLPPTPPPDIDVDAWLQTLDHIERRDPQRLALVHFGVFADVSEQLRQLRRRLVEWRDLVAAGADESTFSRTVRNSVAAEVDEWEAYERAMPLWQSYAGLRRAVERGIKPSRSRAIDAG